MEKMDIYIPYSIFSSNKNGINGNYFCTLKGWRYRFEPSVNYRFYLISGASKYNALKLQFSVADPTGGAYSAAPGSLADGAGVAEGLAAPPARTLLSALGPSGLILQSGWLDPAMID